VIAEGEKCREGMMTVAVTTQVGLDPAKLPVARRASYGYDQRIEAHESTGLLAPATSSDDGRVGD
jgi:hypothetical protein